MLGGSAIRIKFLDISKSSAQKYQLYTPIYQIRKTN